MDEKGGELRKAGACGVSSFRGPFSQECINLFFRHSFVRLLVRFLIPSFIRTPRMETAAFTRMESRSLGSYLRGGEGGGGDGGGQDKVG